MEVRPKTSTDKIRLQKERCQAVKELGCDAEIYAIYLLEEAQRKGLGAKLVRELVRELAVRGFSSLAVWVLALNPATRFYECLGGKVIGQKAIELGGQTFIEVAYGWQSLNVFL